MAKPSSSLARGFRVFGFRVSSFSFGILGSGVTGLRIVEVQDSGSKKSPSKKVIVDSGVRLASVDGDFLVECLSGYV